jgi:hypothetical protein
MMSGVHSSPILRSCGWSPIGGSRFSRWLWGGEFLEIPSILGLCWRIKLVSTYDPQAYGPTPFSPRDSQGSCQSAEQGDY